MADRVEKKRTRKMKILQTSQKYFAFLGISSEQSKQKLYFNYEILLGFVLLGYSLVAHFVYLICIAESFDKYIECTCATIATFVITTCFVAMVFGMIILFQCIDKFENLIETRLQFPASKALFKNTDRQVEKVGEIIISIIAKASPWCMILPKFFICFSTYFTTDLGNDSFELPLPLWTPFDSKNPIGFLVGIALQYGIIAFELYVIACVLSLAIGAFIFAIASSKEIKTVLHDFDKVINDDQSTSDNRSYHLQQFSTFIVAHSTVKQVAADFSNVFQPIFMVLFSWSIIAICGLMLLIQIEIFHHENNNNSMALFVTIFGSGYAFGAVFIACELGQRINDAFDEVGVLMYQTDWYLFSTELRRLSVIILAVSKHPVSLQCFGSISCTRESFKKIVNSAFSYFMTLRQFGK